MLNQIDKVKLRLRETATNNSTLFLDYSINGKRHREHLGLKIFNNPKSVLEKKHNKEILLKANFIKNEREKQFFSDEIDEALERKKRSNSEFYEYLKTFLSEYKKKDRRTMLAVFNSFTEFAPPPLSVKEVDENFCTKFRDYLSDNFNGETPASYFARFKKVIKQAYKDKYLKYNPVEDIKSIKSDDGVKKDVLSIEELKALKNTECGNLMVKNAFLFSCNTGLRYVDIIKLKWKNIIDGELVLEQSKTDIKIGIPLNENAKIILSSITKENDIIFKLPSHNAVLKNLNLWAKKGGIEKHITFHCARHTFGTTLAFYGNDVASISKLLGHTSLKHTMKYVRIGKELKEKAVNSIPKI